MKYKLFLIYRNSERDQLDEFDDKTKAIKEFERVVEARKNKEKNHDELAIELSGPNLLKIRSI